MLWKIKADELSLESIQHLLKILFKHLSRLVYDTIGLKYVPLELCLGYPSPLDSYGTHKDEFKSMLWKTKAFEMPLKVI